MQPNTPRDPGFLKTKKKKCGIKRRYFLSFNWVKIVSKFWMTWASTIWFKQIQLFIHTLVLMINSKWGVWTNQQPQWNYCEGATTCWSSSSVPKYRSPNSPMPGMTRKSLFRPISISEVTIFILGKLLQTTCTPWGAWWDK